MTEDEDDLVNFSSQDKDTWKLKQAIRSSFKKDLDMPVT